MCAPPPDLPWISGPYHSGNHRECQWSNCELHQRNNTGMKKLVFGWERVRIETIQRQADYLEILLSPTTANANCPVCEQSASRIHSDYQRSLQDLPRCGQVLRLRISVRWFFCDNAACRRKVFAEQLTELMLPYARRTVRHNEALTTLGLAHGGESGPSE